MADYRLEFSTNGDALVVICRGDISSLRYSELRNDYNAIHQAMTEARLEHLIFDMTQTTFFGSLFVGMVVRLALSVWGAGGGVAFCGLSDQLTELLENLIPLEQNVSAARRVSRYPDLDQALSGVRTHLTA